MDGEFFRIKDEVFYFLAILFPYIHKNKIMIKYLFNVVENQIAINYNKSVMLLQRRMKL